MEPIILYGAGQTPNPIKVAIVLEELGLPFNVVPVSMKDGIKKEPYISINPNGRLPSIEDPNTGVKLFEVLPINKIPYWSTTNEKSPVQS
jgi:glutathione S-transferase